MCQWAGKQSQGGFAYFLPCVLVFLIVVTTVQIAILYLKSNLITFT